MLSVLYLGFNGNNQTYRNTRNTIRQSRKLLSWLLIIGLCYPALSWAFYDIPSGRRIAWNAGLDPVGGIPSAGWTVTTPLGLHQDGSQNDAGIINKAIATSSPNTVIYLPAGTYLVSSNITMKSNVVLRGAGAEYPWLPKASPGSTVLVTAGGAGFIRMGTKATAAGAVNITSGYTKGSTTLTLASASGLAVNQYISIFEDNDTTIPVDSSGCDWCGDDSDRGTHCLQQYSKITDVSGNTITIDPPMYFTYSSDLNPQIRKVSSEGDFSIYRSGLENLKMNNAGGGGPMISIESARDCWVKNVETYNAGSSAKQGHVQIEWSFSCEIRDSHFHHGRSHNSDRNYGVYGLFWNSNHKIENNILFSNRHGILFEGGGSGCAILYNFLDGNYEGEDPGYLSGDLNPNHGPHPHMNLIEGNISAKVEHDSTMGSSSHDTMFRNWTRGYRSTPAITSGGENGMFTQNMNNYMNFWGNVVGMPAWTAGTVVAHGSSYPSEPVVFVFGYDDSYEYLDSKPYATALMHGNYDYITDGVASWLDADHALRKSMYYSSKPSWYGGCIWPPIGPDVSGYANDTPAKLRYEGSSCLDPLPPLPPTNLRIIR